MLKDFREFVMRGNVVDMAVGIIIGGAFGAIVKSMVDDVMMPPLGLALQGVDFSEFFVTLKEGTTPGPYATLAEAKAAAATTLNYGKLVNSVISFVIMAFCVYLLIKGINAMRRKQEAAPPPPSRKECGFCHSEIPIKATRCPFCTSQLSPA